MCVLVLLECMCDVIELSGGGSILFFLDYTYVLNKSLYAVWYRCETSSSQPCISQYCRPSRFYLVRDRKILRWYFPTSKLTAFNQSLADQDLIGPLPSLSARYRTNFNNANSLQTSCFFLLHFKIFSL